MGRRAGVLGAHRFKIKEHVCALDCGSARTSNLEVLRAGSRTRGDCAEHEPLDADGNAAYQVAWISTSARTPPVGSLESAAVTALLRVEIIERALDPSMRPKARRFPPVSTNDTKGHAG
jgi:hypothetical protein